MSEAPSAQAVLVGLPGAGKTTVGRAVAELLRCPFTDLDEWIEAASGTSVSRIFSSEGEDAFRKLEARAIEALFSARSGVVAAGGGWIANARAMALVPPTWRTIYLRVDPGIAAGRLAGSAGSRPLLADRGGQPGGLEASLLRLFESRRGAYESADTTIDTSGVPLDIVVQRVATVVAGTLRGD